jgi:hypothetical protein
VRSFGIRLVLPTLLAALPGLAGLVVFAALPPDARRHYAQRLEHSPFDWLILALGLTSFAVQTVLAWKALRWDVADFDLRPDRWLSHLLLAAEWFPLLGLLGTVAAILQTFSSIAPGTTPTAQDIIRNYAPAITATGSGLFMALLNILPAWVVTAGRDLLRSLAGEATPIVPLTPAQESGPAL